MIPRAVAEELGQPLPLFIKWDDADYGLRAGEHGYPTVTLPGAAIWHMAWSDKDDAIDWQAYFHLRNRLVVAALHWDGNIRGLVASHFKATMKHLLCLEYSTVAIQNRAMDDFLAGPDNLFTILESALPDVRAMRNEYPDAVVLESATSLPAPSDKKWRRKVKIPTSPPAIAIRLTRGVVNQLKPHDPEHHVRPQINVATQDARWFSLCMVDGVTVTTADGRGVVYRQRDREKMFELLRESLKRQALLARRFNRLRKVYRNALPELTSKEVGDRAVGLPAGIGRCPVSLEGAGGIEGDVIADVPRGEDAILVGVQSALTGRPASSPAPGCCRTSVSTAWAGSPSVVWARCCNRSVAGPG